jgi:hypothetical protein
VRRPAEVAQDQCRSLVREHPRQRADDVVDARRVVAVRFGDALGIELDLVGTGGG